MLLVNKTVMKTDLNFITYGELMLHINKTVMKTNLYVIT